MPTFTVKGELNGAVTTKQFNAADQQEVIGRAAKLGIRVLGIKLTDADNEPEPYASAPSPSHSMPSMPSMSATGPAAPASPAVNVPAGVPSLLTLQHLSSIDESLKTIRKWVVLYGAGILVLLIIYIVANVLTALSRAM